MNIIKVILQYGWKVALLGYVLMVYLAATGRLG
jgi:hypothetical protein